MMTNSEAWYVVKQPDGHCEIMQLGSSASNSQTSNPPPTDNTAEQDDKAELERWGPFDSQGQAIARRVGLIRAGKCKPA